MRKFMLTAAIALGTASIGVPASAQQQGGLVNVNVGDIAVDINRVISDNNLNVQVPVGAAVQVPIGIAANICNVSAAVLGRADTDGAACTATSETASNAEIETLARSLQRQR